MAFGRMERSRSGEPPLSDINITPLVDVMLVLVVIFILTAPLLASAIRLDLPRSDAATPGEAPHAVLLTLDANGQAYLDGTQLSLPALAEQLARVAAQDAATEVQLRANASVPYGRVVALMGLVQKAGLSRIGFVAEPVPTF